MYNENKITYNKKNKENYYSKPMFSVYIKAIERYIHPHEDFDTTSTDCNIKEYQTRLFSIDIDFLIFFLNVIKFIGKSFNDITDKDGLYNLLSFYNIDFCTYIIKLL